MLEPFTALRSMQAPSIDGLTVEFYKAWRCPLHWVYTLVLLRLGDHGEVLVKVLYSETESVLKINGGLCEVEPHEVKNSGGAGR